MGACCHGGQQAAQIEAAVTEKSPSSSPVPQTVDLKQTHDQPLEELKSHPTNETETGNNSQALDDNDNDDNANAGNDENSTEQHSDPDDGNLHIEHERSPQHWKTQTLQILTELSGVVNLGGDFEDSYEDEKAQQDLPHDDDHESAQPQQGQGDEEEPRALVNIPRKSYISYANDRADTAFELHIGQTLKRGHSANEEASGSVWKECDASRFKLRSIAYAKNKKSKLQPSQPALFDVIAVDCFQINDQKVANLSDLSELLAVFNLAKYTTDVDARRDSRRYPRLLVLNLMIPLFTKNERNGVQILIYAQMSEAFLNGAISTEDASVKLLENLLNKQELAMNSFKMTLAMPNVHETTLKALTKKLVKTLNGKCMALKQHATYGYMQRHVHEDEEEAVAANSVETKVFVVNFNGFGLNKQMIKGLSTIREHLGTIEFEIGFHIGSKLKQGLPERMLLCVKLNKLDLNHVVEFKEFYRRKREQFEQEEERKKHVRIQTYVMDGTDD